VKLFTLTSIETSDEETTATLLKRQINSRNRGVKLHESRHLETLVPLSSEQILQGPYLLRQYTNARHTGILLVAKKERLRLTSQNLIYAFCRLEISKLDKFDHLSLIPASCPTIVLRRSLLPIVVPNLA